MLHGKFEFAFALSPTVHGGMESHVRDEGVVRLAQLFVFNIRIARWGVVLRNRECAGKSNGRVQERKDDPSW